MKKTIDTLSKERETFPSRLGRARKTMIFNSAVTTGRVSTEVAAVINVQFRGRSNSQLSDTPTKGNDVKTGRERRERGVTSRQRIVIIIIEMHVHTFCLFNFNVLCCKCKNILHYRVYQEREATPNKIGVEIWLFLKGSHISETGGVTPTKTGVHARDVDP